MAFAHSKDSRLLLDDVHFSVYLRNWEHSTERETADTTVHTDDGHRFILGLDNGSLSLGGLVDNNADSGGQDEILDSALGASAGSLVTAAPAGLAVGNRIISIEARESAYSISAPVAEAVGFTASWRSEGQIDVGVSLHGLSAETLNGNGAGVDNESSTSNGGVGALHVTSASGTSPTLDVVIQHSADAMTWVDLVTFPQVTAAAAERIAVTGTVNRHLRATWTVGGTSPSLTFAAAFSRR